MTRRPSSLAVGAGVVIGHGGLTLCRERLGTFEGFEAAPALTRATRWGALTPAVVPGADSTSLNTVARAGAGSLSGTRNRKTTALRRPALFKQQSAERPISPHQQLSHFHPYVGGDVHVYADTGNLTEALALFRSWATANTP